MIKELALKNRKDFWEDWQEEILEEGYEKGRREVLEEIKHEQKRMLDGFGHPKDCEICFLEIQTNQDKE